jgi:DNA-binding PadR family transcriptional regulator
MHHEHHVPDEDTERVEGPDGGGRRFGRRRRAAFGDFGPTMWGMGRGFGGPRGGGCRGRGRARRGDVRAALLALLAERPMHGYEMIGELEERTGGVWKPSPGSVYPTLQLLEDEGLVSVEELDGKRRFSLTDAGRAATADREGPAPWEDIAREHADDADHAELRDGIGQLFGAVRQVAVAGSDEQRRRAVEVLADARRQLYGILAEGG